MWLRFLGVVMVDEMVLLLMVETRKVVMMLFNSSISTVCYQTLYNIQNIALN